MTCPPVRVLLIAGLAATALSLSGCGKIAHTLDTPDGEDHPLNFYPSPKLDPQPNAKEAVPSSADQPGAPATIQPATPYGVMPDSPVITNSGPMMGGTTTNTPASNNTPSSSSNPSSPQ